MNKHKIKVAIAGRQYPMHVTADEEEVLRKAAKIIKDLVDDYSEKYELRDQQDALAMCSLQYVAKSLYQDKTVKTEYDEVETRISDMISKIKNNSLT